MKIISSGFKTGEAKEFVIDAELDLTTADSIQFRFDLPDLQSFTVDAAIQDDETTIAQSDDLVTFPVRGLWRAEIYVVGPGEQIHRGEYAWFYVEE